MDEIREIIVRQLDLENRTYMDSAGFVYNIEPSTAYLLLNSDRTHERYVADDKGVVSRQVKDLVDSNIKTENGSQRDVNKIVNERLASLKEAIDNFSYDNPEFENNIRDEVNDLTEALEDLQTRINDLPIGKVNEEVLFVLRQNKNLVASEYIDVTARYNNLMAENKLYDKLPLRLAFENNQNGYLLRYNELMGFFDSAFNDSNITEAEKAELNDKFDKYRSSLSTLSYEMQQATNRINKAIAGDIDEQIEERLDVVNLEIGDVGNKLTDLQDNYLLFATDGVFSIAETEALKTYIQTLNNEKADVFAKYEETYGNAKLEGAPKTGLFSAWENYAASHDSLINKINEAIEDGLSHEQEVNEVNVAFTDYRAKLALLSRAFEIAIMAIYNKVVDDLRQQVEDEIGDINIALQDLETSISNLPIGEVSETALYSIRQQRNIIYNEYTDISNRYWVIHDDVFLTDKTALESAFGTASSGYVKSFNDLYDFLGTAFSDSNITQAEKDSLEVFLGTYRSNLATLSTAMQDSLKAISSNRIEDVRDYFNTEMQELNQEIIDVDGRVTSLQTEYSDFASDGVFTVAEAKALKAYINNLENEKEDIDRKYQLIYNNSKLAGIPKSTLLTEYNAYDFSHLDLIDTILDAIADSKSEPSEVALVDSKFATYREELANLREAFENALDYISTAKATDVVDMVFDGTGYFDPNKIKPVSIETKHIAIADRMQRFSMPGVRFVLGSNNSSITYSSGTLVHQTIDVTPKTWNITGATISGITTVFNYIYAKCSRTTTTATIVVTSAQINVEDDPDFFHFEVGNISALLNGTRFIKTTYGFASINPAELTIGRWSSPLNPNQYIEHTEQGVNIVAKEIKFLDPDDVVRDVSEVVEGIEDNLVNLNAVRDYINNVLPGELSTIQNQIDGSITNWFYGYAPTLSNAPASAWTTTELKNIHLGDVFYDTVTGYAYRFKVLSNVYSWERITDSDITKALADAAKAQDTADGKRRVFVVQPVTPYDIGDLWVQGSNGDIMRCATMRLTGSFVAGDWVKASKYTDDTRAIQAEANAKNYADGLKQSIDSEISQINSSLSDLDTYVDGAFADSIIQNAEAVAIEKYLNDVDTQKADLDSRYTTIYSDTELSGTAKSDLQSKKSAYNTAHTNLKSSINTAIADSKTTPTEKADVDSKFTAYRTALSDLSKSFDVAIDFISQVKATKALTDANAFTQSKIDDVNGDITDVNTRVTGLQDLTNTAFKDGVIDLAEKESLKAQIKSLETEKADLDNRFTSMYANTNLASTAKTNLNTAKNDYNAKHSALLSAINTAIADSQITPAEQTAVDTAFTNYKTSLGTLATRFEQAIRYIEVKTATDLSAQARIDAQAYTDALDDQLTGEIGDLNTQLSTLQTEINDLPIGALTDTALFGIKQQKNIVQSEYSDVYNRYLVIRDDAFLVSKTALNNAYNTYNTAYTSLTSYFDTAFNDKDITQAEKNELNTRFTTYRNTLATFSSAMQTATKTIEQAKVDGAVDGIKVGGRNWFRLSDCEPDSVYAWASGGTGSESGSLLSGFIKVEVGDTFICNHKIDQFGLWDEDKVYLGGLYNNRTINPNATSSTFLANRVIELPEGFTGYIKISFRNDFLATNTPESVIFNKGNKLGDWSPAPEDLDQAISDAQTAANIANTEIAKVSNDNLLTAGEKQSLLREWQVIQGEKASVESQASTVGVSASTYTSRYNTLNSYITPLLANINTDSTITGTTLRTNFKNYYDAKIALLKAVTDKLNANNISTDAKAVAAQTAASNAQTAANTANTLLTDMASDSKLTPDEKQDAKKEWDIIVGEKPKIDASAAEFGVSSTAYGSAYSALSTYITPLLSSLTTTSNIVGSTFRSTFKAYYDAKIDLLNAIASKGKENTDNIQIGGRNLLRNSGITKSNSAYQLADYTLSETLVAGEELTLTIWGALGTDRVSFQAYNSGGSGTGFFGTLTLVSPGVYQLVAKWKVDYSNSFLRIYQVANTGTSASTINKIKLERGNKATDWAPSPEDVQYEIDNIQVGGRNLWRYSGGEYLSNNFFYGNDQLNGTITILNGYRGFLYNNTSAAPVRIRSVDIKADSTYTISFIAFLDDTTTFNTLNIYIGHYSAGSYGTQYATLTKTPTKLVFTFVSKIDATHEILHIMGLAKGAFLADFKIEEGNRATSWTPAPEDVQAQIDANVQKLSDMASDNILDPVEKKSVKQEWENILSEYTNTLNQATALGVSTTAYTSAYNTLSSYITPLISNMNVNSTIVRTTFISNFKNYYAQKSALEKAVSDKLNANNISTDAKAVTAQTAATNAQNSANTANTALANIASDSVLTAVEKKATKKEWDIIVAERASVLAQAGTYSVDTTAYTNAYNALNTYITPLLSNLNVNSSIVGSTFRSTFKNYYDSKIQVLQAVTDKIKRDSRIVDLGEGVGKKFLNPASFVSNTNANTGYLIIRTSIVPNTMVTTKISGFIYHQSSNIGSGVFNLEIACYHYSSSSSYATGYVQSGTVKIPSVQVGRDSSNRMVYIIGLSGTNWAYPKISVDESIVGQSNVPDTFADGWSIEISTDISGFSLITNIPGSNVVDDIKLINQEVTDVENKITGLQDLTDTAFKNGIIDTAEAKAIEKYINLVNAEKEDLDREYNSLYDDTLLTGAAKTNLYNAKVAYNTAHTSLITSINSAVSGGKATPSQKADVDSKFTAYRTTLGTLATRLTEAYKAIDTARVDNIQIGGRNLIIVSTSTKLAYLRNDGAAISNSDYNHTDYISVVPGETIIVSGYSNLGYAPSTCFYNSSKVFISGIAGASGREKVVVPAGAVFMRFSYQKLDIGKIKLERGNKATDWTPAPEDVVSDYVNLINQEIGDVENKITGLQDLTNVSFKNGIIDTAEAKAIEKYINLVNAEKEDLDREYNSLYADTLLTGTAKTNLYNAKVAYNSAHTSLISSINTAVSGGKATPAQKADVDSKFTTYRTNLGTLSTRFAQAYTAIEAARVAPIQQQLSAAEQKVIDLESKSGAFTTPAINTGANTLVSGNLLIGNEATGTTAVLTGENPTDNNAVRLAIGATFANRNNAPFRVLQGGTAYMSKAIIISQNNDGGVFMKDGILTTFAGLYNENATVQVDWCPIIRMGYDISQGRAIHELYLKTGDFTSTLISELGATGMQFLEGNIAESWSNSGMRLVSSNTASTDTTLRNILKGSTFFKFVDFDNGDGTWKAGIYLDSDTAVYRYNAGRNLESNNYVQYEPVYFQSALTPPSKPTSVNPPRLSNGIYTPKFGVPILLDFTNSGAEGATVSFSKTVTLYKVVNGISEAPRNLVVSGTYTLPISNYNVNLNIIGGNNPNNNNLPYTFTLNVYINGSLSRTFSQLDFGGQISVAPGSTIYMVLTSNGSGNLGSVREIKSIGLAWNYNSSVNITTSTKTVNSNVSVDVSVT